jgi:pimeloyl-ACP methyl ester carboxylesterase
MKKAKKKTAAWAAAGAVGAALGAYCLVRSQQEKATRIEQLFRKSQIIDTPRGPIETEIEGEGPAIIVAHGALGGYDRARLYSFPEAGFRFICPSRPGYLRTPLSVAPTFEEQADALADLLDVLGIEKAAIIGCSAGGPVAIHFALRHPDRCWAMVLGNSITGPLSTLHGLMEPTARLLFGWDWLTWFGVNRVVLYSLRPTLFLHCQGDPLKQQRIISMLHTMYPTSARKPGFVNDMHQIQSIPSYPLEQVHVATLVAHGTHDIVVPYSHGERAARAIPGAQFLSIEAGTHLDFISHVEMIQPKIVDFLKNHYSGKSDA